MCKDLVMGASHCHHGNMLMLMFQQLASLIGRMCPGTEQHKPCACQKSHDICQSLVHIQRAGISFTQVGS